MAKIIEITAESISIGMDDSSIREVRPSDVNFLPQLGDEVDLYETGTRVVVQKHTSAQTAVPEGGIHINAQSSQQADAAGNIVV